MGLSSSQGRLLLLTARISDIELSEILISQKQMQLAIDRENVGKEYQDAMSNYKIVIKVQDTDTDNTATYTKEDLSYNNLCSAGYMLINANNQVYLKKNSETGEWEIPEGIKDYIHKDEETGQYKVVVPGINDENSAFEIIDGTDLFKSSSAISNSIVNGAIFVINTSKSLSGISIDNLNSDTNMEYVLDTSDDAQAESKYEYELAKISRQDNMLDMELQQLETQHEALLKEYDSIKKLISNNIDRTFDLFNNG